MNKDYLVTKSNYFIMNSSYDLSLEEQKIILTLASMVQPTDEEFKPYDFRIADFMKLLGIEDKSKYTEIPKITKELMKKVFEIQDGKKLIQVAWLSSAEYEKGTGMVELQFSPKLKPYMIKLGTLFTQYKLANILSMKSKYSPRIYEILKCNEFKKQKYIEIKVEDIRRLLKVDNIYPLYNDFKRFVIERTQKELKRLSDISFDFEEIKTGRKVTSLKFYIHINRQKDEIASTVDIETAQSNSKVSDAEQVQAIFREKISLMEAQKILDAAGGNISIVRDKYSIVKGMANCNNVVGATIQAIKQDWKPGTKKKLRWNDYDQRTYDIKELEKQLRANYCREEDIIE
jgi:plasmid replication initiation protein